MTTNLIDEITAEIDDAWREASYATSGGEGMARMVSVRASQAKLADALVAAADAAPDDATARAQLSRARATFMEVLTSAHGPDYVGRIGALDAVLSRLELAPDGDHRAIATAWVELAEREAKHGLPREARELGRKALALLDKLPAATDLRTRAEAI